MRQRNQKSGQTGRDLETDQRELEQLKSDYLMLARQALDRAKALLTESDSNQFIYAALELRRAFEALVYENALRFTDELVGEDYSLWQPLQLLERLIEIDPAADAELEMQLHDPKTDRWVSLGRQQRIGLAALRKRYHALGNHLHTPPLAQMMRGRRQTGRSLSKLCHECVGLIEADLGASLRIGQMAIFGYINLTCLECGAAIRRRLNALRTRQNEAPGTKDLIVAKCSKCLASYEIRSDGADDVICKAQRWIGHCPYSDCEGVHKKWMREVKDGMISSCPSCGRKAVFAHAYAFLPEAIFRDVKRSS